MEPFWHQYPQYPSLNQHGTPHLAGFRTVGVYNGDTYVETIHLATLKRFSLTALAAFPPSVPVEYPQLLTSDPKGGSSDASEHTPRTESARSGSISLPDTLPTEITDTTERCQKLVLRLSLNALQLPSNTAILATLGWMRRNAEIPLDGTLHEFPCGLDCMGYWDMVDLYQAALSFDMRPFPHRLKHKILDHITNSTPDANMVSRLTRYLPIDDAAILRLINTIENRRKQCVYTQADLDAINSIVTEDKDLEAKVAEISDYRRAQWRVRNQNMRLKEFIFELSDASATARAGAADDQPSGVREFGELQETSHKRRRRRRGKAKDDP